MTPIQRLAGFAVLLLAAGALGAAQTTLPQDSPFAPVGGAAAAAGTQAAESFILSGASATSQGVRVCIYDTQAKHSQWLGMGESFHGVQALAFDPESDRATVRINGAEKVLQLHEAAFAPSPNAPPPFTVLGENSANGTVTVLRPGGAPGAPPQTDTKTIEQLHQEREARMMVSDLLEIGMRQRKAYQDAKRKAAGLPPSGS